MLKRFKMAKLLLLLLTVTAICMTAITAYSSYGTYGTEDTIEIVHNRTVEEIVNMAKLLEHTGFISHLTQPIAYREEPSFTAPYRAGSLFPSDLADAENAMKMVRFLAGVPYEDVCFRDDLNNIAQHGAVLLAASDQFSHTPSRPSDMSNDFFELGYRGCSEANIFAGLSNLSDSVLGFVYDAGSNNVARVGHRRWILNPGNQNFGIGYAKYASSSYSGYRINMHVFDGNGPYDSEFDSYIAWPNAGAFPIQYLLHDTNTNVVSEASWSINLGSPYLAPDKSEIVLTLTRQRDGQTWVFDASTPNLGEEGLSNSRLHLSTDNSGYGILKAIVFRPDPDTLGTIRDGDVFTVALSGLRYQNGTPAELTYDINFFDLEKEMKRSSIRFDVSHGQIPLSNVEISVAGQTVHTDETGTVSVRVANYTEYSYSVQIPGCEKQTGKIEVTDSSITESIVIDEHLWDGGAVEKEVTRTEEGLCRYTCEVCAETKEEVIPVLEWNNPFQDINRDDSFYRAVEYVYENNLFIGTSDTEFSPEMTMTRGMFVTVLGRMAGVEALPVTESAFADVQLNEWYTPYVGWAVENEIVLGYDNGCFGPTDKINIEQACVILARYAAFLGMTMESDAVLDGYSDHVQISGWALTQMQWMVEHDVYCATDNLLLPKAEAMRSTVAQMMYRFSMIVE